MHTKIRVAVLGVGSLGKEHARIYAELAAAGKIEFTGVYDTLPANAARIKDKLGVRVFQTLAEALDCADAFSVVTPTSTHYQLAKALLAQSKHVLVEKPITDNAEQATELVELARGKNCILQVGHIERFNPVFTYLEKVATDPRFIETHRLSPHPGRSTDIGVVLDLMIHDLDIVLAFVKSPVVSVEGIGIGVLSKSEDIANARLRFANGCVANLTVSRISPERMRKIRVFSGPTNPCYISLDATGQAAFVANYAGSSITTYRVLPSGALSEPVDHPSDPFRGAEVDDVVGREGAVRIPKADAHVAGGEDGVGNGGDEDAVDGPVDKLVVRPIKPLLLVVHRGHIVFVEDKAKVFLSPTEKRPFHSAFKSHGPNVLSAANRRAVP